VANPKMMGRFGSLSRWERVRGEGLASLLSYFIRAGREASLCFLSRGVP